MVRFIFDNTLLFTLSERVPAPSLSAGELVEHEGRVYRIADIEHRSRQDGASGRYRLESDLFLQAVGEEELHLRRQGRSALADRGDVPRRY